MARPVYDMLPAGHRGAVLSLAAFDDRHARLAPSLLPAAGSSYDFRYFETLLSESRSFASAAAPQRGL